MAEKGTKRLSAREFFKDIKEEPDATRVEKEPRSYNVKAGGPRYLHEGSNIHPAMKEDRRLYDAQMKGSEDAEGWYQGGEPDWEKAKNEYNTKATDYSTWVGQSMYAHTRGKEPQNKNIKTADDMEVYAKQQRAKTDPSLKHSLEAKSAREKRDRNIKAQSVAKADTFEKNLTKFDQMDTKKNPGGWAKSFFEDLHDKKVK